ncbi:alpha/beta fold hydrolase [Rudaeicoccus suwonensis]|uniref:Pimeloyl-ACP methyl ester carboxylesterase n=1 Tax=Rudaeicoccus suwonensis TaxID=657409 RepID=A0A561E2Z5_9MICO|nr:alpha/beta hydrolase [Rudaeicoccus suwonensis]TWE09961.1 pimeloyl-ACP methyl ester carboxylesterase [Rudaeicoccus suwonensis]
MDTFVRDGLTFDVTDSGPAGGEVVILLHGFPQDRRAWDKVTPELNAAGHRTLAPDQRGYSPRATPKSRTAYGLDQLALDVIALADAAGAARVHVVGHDWGGAVAWHLASRHSDRVASVTVLSTPHPAAMGWAFTHSDQWRKSGYMVFFQLPWIAERSVHRRLPGLYVKTGMTAEDAAKYAEKFATPASLSGGLGWYRSMPASKAMLSSMKRSAKAKRAAAPSSAGAATAAPRSRKVQVPTTYVWGSHDFALGRAAAEKTAEFIGGDYEFVEVPDAGHWLPEVNADLVSEAILQRITSAGATDN